MVMGECFSLMKHSPFFIPKKIYFFMLTTFFEAFQNFNTFLWNWILAGLLIALGLYFTIQTRGAQFRFLSRIPALFRSQVQDREKQGLTPAEAFFISTGARVGVGNIAGIALAITTGGPGAIFWMWVCALIGAASGFLESTLAQLYKRPDGQGGFSGGPVAYIRYGLKSPWASIVFAFLLALADGLIFNSVLSNTVALQMKEAFNWPTYWSGALLAAYAIFIALSGTKSLGRFSSRIVPFMIAAYFFLVAVCAILYWERIPLVFSRILTEAFQPDAALGASLWFVIMTGVRRGLYSNEAGQGTVPNVAATANAQHPCDQGVIQAFGVYVDTIFVCTLTAILILVLPETRTGTRTGIELVIYLLQTHLGTWAAHLLFTIVLFFALTSIIGNFLYSDIALKEVTKCPRLSALFRTAVIAMIFFGAQWPLTFVWSLADFFLGIMVVTNSIALIALGPKVYRLLKHYRKELRQKGRPSFVANEVFTDPEKEGIVCWPHK